MNYLKRLYRNIPILLVMWVLTSEIHAQKTTYYYPLNGNFNEATNATDSLFVWPNLSGQTGSFVTRTLPPTTCSGVGEFSGYAYENDAGLRFTVPPGFISCAYSIQFTWNYDNPGGLQEWIRVVSFIHVDDSGIQLWTQSPSTQGDMYFWHPDSVEFLPGLYFFVPSYAPLSPAQYYNDTDFYQVTLTRQCNDTIKLYTNGVYMGGYHDSTQKYMPQGPSPQIVLFKDTFETECSPIPFPNEASPGFVKDLIISDSVFTPTQIADDFTRFCPLVLPLTWEYFEVKKMEEGILLHGLVNDPQQVEQYTIERKVGGENFSPIAYLEKEETHSWGGLEFLDLNPVHTQVSYRVKAVDINGHSFYSPVKELAANASFNIYPNPSKEFLWIEVPLEAIGQKAKILSPHGRLLQTHTLLYGKNLISLEDLPNGLLLIKIGNEESHKIIKMD